MALPPNLKAYLKRTPLYTLLRTIRDMRAVASWRRRGKPAPPPHVVKVQTVKRFAKAYGLTTFVETGTYLGDMLYGTRHVFKRAFSVELDPTLAKNAQQRLRSYQHITVHCGDSAAVLAAILPELDQPTLFWLDAHYSGHITARGSKDTPIEAELRHIASNPHAHVILIDDARCFTGENDYPTIASLKEMAAKYFPGSSFAVEDDIIRIVTAARNTISPSP